MYTRVEVNCINFAPTAAQEATKPMGGPILRNFAVLEIFDKNGLQFSYSLVVIFDKLWELADMSTDMDSRGGIGGLYALVDCSKTLV